MQLTKDRQHSEWKTILLIAKTTVFQKLLIRLKQQIQHKIAHSTKSTNTNIITKWATFTYITPHIRKIIKFFKYTNVKVTFICSNTISQLTISNTRNSTPSHDKSGIYKSTCNTCKLAYVGQTSQNLKLRYQEHLRYIRNNSPQSVYARSILRNQHEYGTMDNIMTLLKALNKTTMLIPYEQVFIQSLHKEVKLTAEQYPGEQNPLFQSVNGPSYTSHDVTG